MSTAWNATKEQSQFLCSDGNLLITGGPGSGKTTSAIVKAGMLAKELTFDSQRVLFLSFARPTISRVIQSIEENKILSIREKKRIEVNTYHSFFWQILKSHGYLIGLPRSPQVLMGAREAEALAALRQKFGGKPRKGKSAEDSKRYDDYQKELKVLLDKEAFENGNIGFDLFAPLVSTILSKSDKISKLISSKYTNIILDEFQDTDSDQWDVMKFLGNNSTLIALADPEQQIYRWKGADPRRLQQYQDIFKPTFIDFQQQNHRSSNTDIGLFGNEVLSGKFTKDSYKGVNLECYGNSSFVNEAMALTSLFLAVIKARKRLIESKTPNWSLAILTGSKQTTKKLSDKFRHPPKGKPKLEHRPMFDLEAAILGAEVVASCMSQIDSDNGLERFLNSYVRFLKGRNGDLAPKQNYLNDAKKISEKFQTYLLGTTVSATAPFSKAKNIYQKICKLELTGSPLDDWKVVRDALEACKDLRLIDAAASTRYLSLLEKGSELKRLLSENWQLNGRYENALKIVQNAFMQEHFSMGNKPETGIVMMNIHKAKGKEFDEVILFDGFHNKTRGGLIPSQYSRIIFGNIANEDTRQNFRVGVTRARKQATILTPHSQCCSILTD